MAKAKQLKALNKIILGRETRVRKLIGGVMRDVPSNARKIVGPGEIFEVPQGRRQKRDDFGEPVLDKSGQPTFESYDLSRELLDKKVAVEVDAEAVAVKPKPPQKPAGKALIPVLVSAMKALADDGEAQTSDGKTSVPALEKHLGYDITAEDRDNAHAAYMAELDADTKPEGSGGNATSDAGNGSQPGLGT